MIFIVNLRFTENKAQASALMEAHNQWIRKGFDDGVLLMIGSLQPGIGGCVLAHGLSREELEARLNEDPFVIEKIVAAEILQIEPKKADERLQFLLD